MALTIDKRPTAVPRDEPKNVGGRPEPATGQTVMLLEPPAPSAASDEVSGGLARGVAGRTGKGAEAIGDTAAFRAARERARSRPAREAALAGLLLLPAAQQRLAFDRYLVDLDDAAREPLLLAALASAHRALAMPLLADALRRHEGELILRALCSENPSRALAAYAVVLVVASKSRRGGRLHGLIVSSLIAGVGHGRNGHGREGVLSVSQARRAAEAYCALSEGEAARMDALLAAAPSEVHAAILCKTLAARTRPDPVSVVARVAEAIDGNSSDEAMAKTSLVRDPPPAATHTLDLLSDRGPGRQQFTTSCGPATVMIAVGEADPAFALMLQDPRLAATYQVLLMERGSATAVLRDAPAADALAAVGTQTTPETELSLFQALWRWLSGLLGAEQEPNEATPTILRSVSPSEKRALGYPGARAPDPGERAALLSVFAEVPAAVRERYGSGDAFCAAAQADTRVVTRAIYATLSADRDRLLAFATGGLDADELVVAAATRMLARMQADPSIASADKLLAALRREPLALILPSTQKAHALVVQHLLGAPADAVLAAFAGSDRAPGEVEQAAIAALWDRLPAEQRRCFSSRSAFALALARDPIAESTVIGAYLARASAFTGVDYRQETILSTPELGLEHVDEALDAGLDVPLRVDPPAHFMLFADSRVDATGARFYLIQDPWSGQSAWLDRDALLSGSGFITLGLWDGQPAKRTRLTHVWLPRGHDAQ